MQENFKDWFKELIIFSFYVEVESENLDTFLKEEFIEITLDLEVNEKKLWQKYPKPCATVEHILPAFPSSYTVESEFSHMPLFTKLTEKHSEPAT